MPLAWALVALGALREAHDRLAPVLAHVRAEGIRLYLAEALLVQALIALDLGWRTDAAQALEEGLAVARGIPYPYAEHACRTYGGSCRRGSGTRLGRGRASGPP